MNVLYVSAEVAPFSASGGLGDVSGALPKALTSRGACVSVISPLYGTVKNEYQTQMTKITELRFNLSWRNVGANVYGIKINGVNYYFIENNNYFNRGRLYGEFDDGERFAFFSMAVLEFIRSHSISVDILHANDWHSALTVIYLKTIYNQDKKLGRIQTVFTIHNIEYQGVFDPNILSDVFGLSEFHRNITEYDGAINLMKGALVSADMTTTVSEGYAEELKYEFYSHGLSPIINSLKIGPVGIPNGMDTEEYSPMNGRDIYYSYDRSNVDAGKLKNKEYLYDQLNIKADTSVPLAVMVTRLASAKGIDLVLHILEELLCQQITIIILGSGNAEYERKLSELSSAHENLVVKIGFDRKLSKKLYAASDMFIMPSRSEPCGLAQMIACSYGSLPIVRSVGGLKDTIIPYGEIGANGFRFDNYNAHELLYTIKAAIDVFKNKKELKKLRQNAMSSDFTWDRSAEKYIKLYENLIK
ncbi:MAG: glycogen synthase [Clostridia bacterium]|nr:glycogen synthase [Clostridia bacterium]